MPSAMQFISDDYQRRGFNDANPPHTVYVTTGLFDALWNELGDYGLRRLDRAGDLTYMGTKVRIDHIDRNWSIIGWRVDAPRPRAAPEPEQPVFDVVFD